MVDGEKPAGTDETTEPEGGEKPPSEGQGGETGGEKPAEKSGEDADALLKALRAERRGRTDAEKRLKALEDEKLSELERVTKERDEAIAERDRVRADLADRDLVVDLEHAALGAGAKPDRALAIAKLIDRAAIERDEDGKPVNLGKLAENVRETAPELFEPKTPSGDADQGARTGIPETGGMNELIRRAAGR